MHNFEKVGWRFSRHEAFKMLHPYLRKEMLDKAAGYIIIVITGHEYSWAFVYNT